MVFGEHDGVVSERATAFLAACRNSGIDAEISPDIRAIWEKFVFLVGLSGTNSAVRLPIGAIRSHPQTRGRLLDAMWEVVAVGRAGGVNVTGVPTPINRVLHDVLARFGGSQQSTANTLASVFFGNP